MSWNAIAARLGMTSQLGLPVKYTNPEALIARYAELMALKDTRAAAKAKRKPRKEA